MEMKREAVSESIGYLIIFSLILTGIGLITLYGYPLLMQQQSSANMRNMEQTMIVLQNDIKSLTYKLANYKETALRVSGGTLSLYGPPYTDQRFRVEVVDGGVPQDLFIPPRLGEIRYSSTNDNTVITLENGAVIEKPLASTGSFMLADPRWYMDTSSVRTLIISFMNVSSSGSSDTLSQTGIGTVRMRLLRSNMTIQDWGASSYDVKITYRPLNTATITPDGYAVAWKTYLTDTNNFPGVTWSGTGAPGADDVYTFSSINKVVIKEYDVMVETL
ncbi:MAG: hypothetical protein LUO97_06685 [Methanomicrobiales archaeon]|nr:hypothetical protein [Methanomicrobiales archaeon]